MLLWYNVLGVERNKVEFSIKGMSELFPIYKTIKRIIFLITCIVVMSVLIFSSIAIAHMVVFSRADYDKYDSDHFLVYDDIDKDKYPREQMVVQ
ncbi:MAG: hypothetical protein HDT39_04205 [Lachnospiraceae bacterium]|nr:hypothetical protein [Lachnospiraceae bacterium]